MTESESTRLAVLEEWRKAQEAREAQRDAEQSLRFGKLDTATDAVLREVQNIRLQMASKRDCVAPSSCVDLRAQQGELRALHVELTGRVQILERALEQARGMNRLILWLWPLVVAVVGFAVNHFSKTP